MQTTRFGQFWEEASKSRHVLEAVPGILLLSDLYKSFLVAHVGIVGKSVYLENNWPVLAIIAMIIFLVIEKSLTFQHLIP